ncbi:hypothetical protein CULT_1130004 [[Clostridium] ultunense Esp]|nr:hypothetical protein CULT_1130004 [[Clostridium] ultunense Esp]
MTNVTKRTTSEEDIIRIINDSSKQKKGTNTETNVDPFFPGSSFGEPLQIDDYFTIGYLVPFTQSKIKGA